MEVPRMLLAIKSKFPPRGYEDLRYTTDKVEDEDTRLPFDKISSTLSKNLGRLPILTTGSWTCGQSASINVYIAAVRRLSISLAQPKIKKITPTREQNNDLMGEKGNWKEFCDVLTIQESIKEMNQAYRKLIPYGTVPTKELSTKWFETGAKDRAPKHSDFSNRTRYFNWYAGRLEDIVSLSSSYAIGKTISLADVLIYNMFRERLGEDEALETLPKYRREPFGDFDTTNRILRTSYPKLSKICDLVGDHPGICKWLKMRGVQRF